MTDSHNIGTIEQVRNVKQITDRMGDPEVDKALAIIVELLRKPDVKKDEISHAITRLEALSAYFGVEASWYKGWGKSGVDERYKKDMYYSLRESFQRLADSVKYQAKSPNQTGFTK